VTGAGGFIGANVVRRLMDDDLEAHAVVQPGSDSWRLRGIDQLVTHDCSVDDAAAVDDLVRSVKPNWVFHLAAHGAYAHQTDFRRMVAANILGTFNLLDALDRDGCCEGFVHTGSSSEYGLKDHAPQENERVAPNSTYAVTKCAATHGVTTWAHRTGMPAVTVRLYSIYGPWEEPTRLLPRLVGAAMGGTLPPLVAPSTARDFVWVGDAVEGIIRAARSAERRPGAVWNLGSGAQTTLEELVAIVRRVFAVVEEPTWGSMANRAWDTDRWIADARLASEQLKWRAKTPLDAGVQEFGAWIASRPKPSRYTR